MNLANLKIGARLGAGFGMICVLLVAIISIGIIMLGHVNEGTKLIVNDRMPKLEAIDALLVEVDDIAIALRNMMLYEDKADRQMQLDEILTSRREAKARLASLEQTLRVPKARELLRKMVDADDKYVKGQDELIRLINAGSREEAKKFLSELRSTLSTYKDAIDELLKLQKDITKDVAVEAENTYSSTRLLMIGLGLTILIFAVAVAYWITVSITTPIAKALQVANTVAAGDLTSRIEASGGDETGQLLQALKAMNESLVRTVSTVRTGTETIASASAQVAAGSQDLSSRTEEQASSLEETASSMEELTATVKQNAENARQANALAEAASAVAARGGEVIAQVVGTMDEINSSASKIADIIGVIDGIAFQTNILALNAAVEAARAGEQGRGFAVVAAEVRNLAQRSAGAAREVKALIGDSTEKVGNGSRLVGEAGATMREIVDSVKRVTDIMAEITAASAEQSAGIDQINQAVTQMDEVTQQNAALVEEAAAAADAMQGQASTLAQAVSIFQLDTVPHAAPRAAVAVRGVPASVRKKPAKPLRPAARLRTANQVQPALSASGASGGDWEEF